MDRQTNKQHGDFISVCFLFKECRLITEDLMVAYVSVWIRTWFLSNVYLLHYTYLAYSVTVPSF
jgi:hypothetical protein